MTKVLRLLTISSLILCLVGCSGIVKRPVFDDDGLPSKCYLVGGGLSLDYSAPSPGTAYVVDMSSKKYIITKSVEAGENIELNIDPTEEDVKTGLESLGIDASQLDIKLFFVPAENTPQADR